MQNLSVRRMQNLTGSSVMQKEKGNKKRKKTTDIFDLSDDEASSGRAF